MAVPASTYTTYDSAGLREDLIDVITNISPVEAWFTSNTGSGKSQARYHEWTTDSLAAAAANAITEGDDATNASCTPPSRTGNYCQIVRKVFQISDTMEAVEKAGRSKESSYQMEKNLKELANDIEYALIINASAVSGASGTARQSKGVLGWITTNVTTGTGTGSEALTESMLTDNLQLIWAEGGKPQNVLCGAFQKRKIDAFTTNARQVNADEKKLTASVSFYESSFGTLAIRLHRIINTSSPSTLVVLGDMGLWKKAWLRPIKKDELARTGSSRKFMIEAELTLESRQEKGSGQITGLTTS